MIRFKFAVLTGKRDAYLGNKGATKILDDPDEMIHVSMRVFLK